MASLQQTPCTLTLNCWIPLLHPRPTQCPPQRVLNPMVKTGPPAQTTLPGAALPQTACHLCFWGQQFSDSKSSRATR
ncbi:rCG50760 [Rattus norvegicus]|uniref:RCG50760 n=1 Tax=Rattus norvegicus TaxID=10116 RepID=A6KC66_RAT|nr:rCG50760 [Rattus norvegicus]